MKVLILILATIFSVGCTTISQERQIASSGQIGCAPNEIQITDNQQYTWISTCKQKKFYCTVAPELSCKEALK